METIINLETKHLDFEPTIHLLLLCFSRINNLVFDKAIVFSFFYRCKRKERTMSNTSMTQSWTRISKCVKYKS